MPFFIVNPRSAGGQTGRLWEAAIRPRIVARFPDAEWALTSRAGEATALAAEAARLGWDLVVAVGGDGTVNEVVNGLIVPDSGEVVLAHGRAETPHDAAPTRADAAAWTGVHSPRGATALAQNPVPHRGGVAERPRHPQDRSVLGIIPRGTGCDFVKSIGVPASLDGALDVLASGRTVEADACEIVFAGEPSVRGRRLSINQCGCGASGEVAYRVNQPGGPQHGLLAFLLATLQVAINYRPRPVDIAVDGGPSRRVNLKALFVCNGQYCGGGMRAARGAFVDDGVLRVVEVNDVGPMQALAQAYRLYTGRLEGVRGVRVYDAWSVAVHSSEHVRVDCDGEQPGRLPATYTVRPRALRLRVGPAARAVRGA